MLIILSQVSDNSTQTFSDSEVLLTSENITFKLDIYPVGEGFARSLTQNSNAVGSAFALGGCLFPQRIFC